VDGEMTGGKNWTRIMKEIGLILAFLTITAMSFGQHLDYKIHRPNDYHRLGTDLKNIDTLSLWNYQLDSPYVTRFQDSVKPIGHISFWRTKPISNDPGLYVQARAPAIDFEIFDIKDSSYCYKSSWRTIVASSCVPPDVGGDVFVIGKFIFLNRSACVNCGSYGTPNIDYCRPTINFIFSRFSGNDISTLAGIVRQLPIKSGRR
jgi:hypothetical protein